MTREEHRYKISDGDWKSVWNKYSGFAGNAVHMYDLAAQRDDKAVEAVALTLKVLNMYNLTDMHGDIPYSEAFQARTPEEQPNRSSILRPMYTGRCLLSWKQPISCMPNLRFSRSPSWTVCTKEYEGVAEVQQLFILAFAL